MGFFCFIGMDTQLCFIQDDTTIPDTTVQMCVQVDRKKSVLKKGREYSRKCVS